MSTFESRTKEALDKPYDIKHCDKHGCDVVYLSTVGCDLCFIRKLESSLSQSLGDHVDTGKYANTLEAKLKELETENKSLRDALFVIGNRDKDCDGRCRPQARKALEKDNE